VRDPEGISETPPGNPPKNTKSVSDDAHLRNVEAEGSNPFTSTGKDQVRGPKVGVPKVTSLST
jgi:hypothetical protein